MKKQTAPRLILIRPALLPSALVLLQLGGVWRQSSFAMCDLLELQLGLDACNGYLSTEGEN